MASIPNNPGVNPRSLQAYSNQPALENGQSVTQAGQTGNTMPVDSGPSPSKVANLKLGENWKSLTAGDPFSAHFAGQSYVKDLKDKNLRGILGELPDSAVPGLKDKAQAGQLQEGDIKQLQAMLVQKGYDVGSTGTDGKFGPKTHEALQHFLKGDAPSKTAPPTGAARPSPREDGQPSQPGTGSTSNTPATTSPDGVMHTGKTTGVPEGYRPLTGQVPPGVSAKAQSLLGLNFGDAVPFEIEGKKYMARIEHHYHPPGYVGGPNGWHKGCTVYQA